MHDRRKRGYVIIMSFRKVDLQRNNIVKKLGFLLPQIDSRVIWADYIPGTAVKTGQSLVAIGIENGDIKYVDISKKSPFKLVNEVLNAMDDYCLEVQFLNSRQVSIIKEDIFLLAKNRAKIANETLIILRESTLTPKECADIVRKAQELGIFPDFFPATNKPEGISIEMLEKFLKTTAATIIDTQILSDLVKEQISLTREDINQEMEMTAYE